MTSKFSPAIDSLKELTAYRLANMADTNCPDSPESEGAEFLSSIRDSVVEQLEWYNNGDYADADDVAQFVGSVRELDTFSSEIADGAPSIWTFTKFKQFTDLAAWQEDVSELSGDETDMEKLAGIALYMIAERLVSALLDEVAEFELEESEED